MSFSTCWFATTGHYTEMAQFASLSLGTAVPANAGCNSFDECRATILGDGLRSPPQRASRWLPRLEVDGWQSNQPKTLEDKGGA
jgi:hypothetical protein